MLTFLVNLSTCVIAIELFVSCPLSSATAAIQQLYQLQYNSHAQYSKTLLVQTVCDSPSNSVWPDHIWAMVWSGARGNIAI